MTFNCRYSKKFTHCFNHFFLGNYINGNRLEGRGKKSYKKKLKLPCIGNASMKIPKQIKGPLILLNSFKLRVFLKSD